MTKDMMFQVNDFYWIKDDLELCKEHIEDILTSSNPDRNEFFSWVDYMGIGLGLLDNTEIMSRLPDNELDDAEAYIKDIKEWMNNIRVDNLFLTE